MSVTAAVNAPAETRLASTVAPQASTPVRAPALADRATTATARVRAQTAVMGISQANVTAAAAAAVACPPAPCRPCAVAQ